MIRLRVRELAERQGIDTSMLAKLAGVHPRTVRMLWNNPYRHTRTNMLAKYARALGVSASELIRSEPGPL